MSSLQYIPRHKRRQQSDRLHGAFAGGFSAGYFNTVGSREGWQPRQDGNSAQPQSVEDFMDEQDHNEWGGPRRVRQDLAAGDQDTDEPARLPKNPSSQGVEVALLETAIASSTQALVPPKNVGQRLLRQLGWRGGNSSIVYLPLLKNPTSSQNEKSDTTDSEVLFLSDRRLRKFQLQQERMARQPIPQPKLDQAGLGFEPHENAPEFQAHFQKRRKQQKLQQQNRSGKNVYRLSNLLGGDATVTEKLKDDDNDYDNYAGYDATRDFVGTKSVGGFALADDDDDGVYDDEQRQSAALTRASNKVMVDPDQYDTIVQTTLGSDSEDGDNERKQPQQVKESSLLGNALAAWASFGTNSKREAPEEEVRLTLDGRRVLPGFAPSLGGEASVLNQRFRGPDLPENYIISQHVFGPNECPSVLQALAHAAQLEMDNARRQQIIEQALESATVQHPTKQPQLLTRKESPPLPPAGSSVFQGLAQSMKNRFTTASVSDTQPSTASSLRATETSKPPQKPMAITRTVDSFAPSPLLCKRFRVSPPKLSLGSVPVDVRRGEERFFEDHVLKAVEESSSGKQQRGKDSASDVQTHLRQPDTVDVERPPMEVYRSIFGSNDEDPSIEPGQENRGDHDPKTEWNMEENNAIGSVNQQQEADTPPDKGLVNYGNHRRAGENGRETDWRGDSSNRSSDDSTEDEERKKRNKKRKKHKREKRLHRSEKDDDSKYNQDDDQDSSRDERRRRRHERKHRKDKSSHKYSKKRKRSSK